MSGEGDRFCLEFRIQHQRSSLESLPINMGEISSADAEESSLSQTQRKSDDPLAPQSSEIWLNATERYLSARC